MSTLAWLAPYLVRALMMVLAAVAQHHQMSDVSTGLMALSVAIPSSRPTHS